LQDAPAAAAADLDAIAARLLAACARGDAASPDGATFLLRRYVASTRRDLGDALSLMLAAALEAAVAADTIRDRAAWLALLADAAPIADDERFATAGRDLVERLRGAWPIDASTAGGLAASAASVDACLRAADVLVPATTIVQAAIDELERSVGGAYRPGEGLVLGRARAGAHATGAAADAPAHVACAGALVTGFDVTGRLPYSMLAEELMQPLRRPRGGACGVECDAARVLCRLAALHRDAGYRKAAVVAPDVDYRADAARILRSHDASARAEPLSDAVRYGLALDALVALDPDRPSGATPRERP
jgi:hypothetical protein